MSVLRTDANIRPRAYQLEMLEASLKENIIVAVSEATPLTMANINELQDGHWKRENSNVGSTAMLGILRTDFGYRNRAVLRISKELEVCPASKVVHIQSTLVAAAYAND
jgi:hypothetical protein